MNESEPNDYSKLIHANIKLKAWGNIYENAKKLNLLPSRNH